MKVNVVYTVDRSTYVRSIEVDTEEYRLSGLPVSLIEEALDNARRGARWSESSPTIVAVFTDVREDGPVAYVPRKESREITTTIDTEVLR